MATNIGDLLNDVLVIGTNVKAIQQRHKEAETRLVDALALVGKPLKVGGSVVIGETLIRRPYEHMPLDSVDIANIDPDLRVST
jgi:hypothetical protein